MQTHNNQNKTPLIRTNIGVCKLSWVIECNGIMSAYNNVCKSYMPSLDYQDSGFRFRRDVISQIPQCVYNNRLVLCFSLDIIIVPDQYGLTPLQKIPCAVHPHNWYFLQGHLNERQKKKRKKRFNLLVYILFQKIIAVRTTILYKKISTITPIIYLFI